MIQVKSFSVNNGDMFYINHSSDNFSIIDCHILEEREDEILEEIHSKSSRKGITRFISTHPDKDHFMGIKKLNDRIKIVNFYCVKNEAIKNEECEHFDHYCELRDGQHAFYIKKDCGRKWMNLSCDNTCGCFQKRDTSGINILWPEVDNEHYKKVLEDVKSGTNHNNVSPIIKYSIKESATFAWFGDLESSFMEKIKDEIILPKVNILFAPHHGRDSGTVPSKWLEQMKPDLIVIGEAPAEHINYYQGYETITQNSAGDILFEPNGKDIDIYVSNDYSVDFLSNNNRSQKEKLNYLGTLTI